MTDPTQPTSDLSLPHQSSGQAGATARFQVVAATIAGLIAGVAAFLFAGHSWIIAALIAWDTAAVVLVASVWATVRHFDAEATARHAVREDPTRAGADALLLAASLVSLLAVGLVIFEAHSGQLFPVILSVFSVVASWTVVHTVYTLRYARLYYAGADGGINFNESAAPSYPDFAYLAFTIGMTFQVSDTALTTKALRRVALRHALLSYLFGTVIVATTINLVAGLGR